MWSGGSLIASASVVESVNPPPSVTLSATPNPTEVRVSTAVVAATVGGTPPYTYQWVVQNGTENTTVPRVEFDPSRVGNVSASLTVIDSVGYPAVAQPIEVEVRTPPLISQMVDVPERLTLGASTTVTVTVVGGSPPFLYNWSGLPMGCRSLSAPFLICTPTSAGSFRLAITVTDTVGGTTNMSLQLVVRPSLFGIPEAETIGLFTGLGLGLAACVILVVALRQSRFRQMREPESVRRRGPLS